MTATYTVILFYTFVPIADPRALSLSQRALCESLGLKGRLLIASEGVNGTFEGTPDSIAAYQAALRADVRFSGIVFKESESNGEAFRKLEVRVRPEVVTLGAGEFDVKKETAPEVTAEELDAFFAKDEDFVILDLRNDHEIEAGRFEKTANPGLKNFRDLPKKISQLQHLKKKKVVAVCTGGIRCEKATCLLKKEGFENLYQLKDGIHTYIQKFPGRHFKGTLFVFDNRMVTPVIEMANREIIARCFDCGSACENYFSDDRVRPSQKVICCADCIEKHAELRSCA